MGLHPMIAGKGQDGVQHEPFVEFTMASGLGLGLSGQLEFSDLRIPSHPVEIHERLREDKMLGY